MKRLFNNRTSENTSDEKTLHQGRLANMRTLTLRRLVSFTGMAALIGAISLVGLAASFDCVGETECVGTEFADTIDDSDDTVTIQAFGGDDTISLDDKGVSADQVDETFAGPGDDRILISNEDAAEIVFGEDGDDSFRVSGDRNSDAVNHTLDGGRGDDFFLIGGTGGAVSLFDGPGADTFILETRTFGDTDEETDPEDGETDINVRLTADNEQDSVLAKDGVILNTIELQQGSGRDVIDCGNGGTIILNGNRKAVDPFGNNLRKAALQGGTAQTGCDTISP